MKTLLRQIETHSTMLRLDQLQVHFTLVIPGRFLQPHTIATGHSSIYPKQGKKSLGDRV